MSSLDRPRLRRGVRLLARGLLALGAGGVLLQLSLLPKLARSVLGWGAWLGAGGPAAGWPQAAPTAALDPFTDLYRTVTLGQPLLPWGVWLLGALLLYAPWRRPHRAAPHRFPKPNSAPSLPPTASEDGQAVTSEDPAPRVRGAGSGVRGGGLPPPRLARHQAAQLPEDVVEPPLAPPAPPRPRRRIPRLMREGIILLALAAICLLGGAVRITNLLPDADGRWPASNFDEMVYYTNARLLAQGELPYRDHFLAHPPGTLYMFAPGLITQARWGSPTAFGTARLWLIGFSLLALPLIFLAGRRLGGPGAGLLAAALLALDGKVAGVAVLETGVNLWSLVALVLYLYTPRTLPRWQRAIRVGLAGAGTGLAALAKIPGIALAGVLPLHALLRRRPGQALGLGVAAAGAALLGLLPFLLIAPEAVVRQTLFFQLLRPQEVRPGIDQAARIADYPESALTILGAMLGLALLTAALVLGRGARRRLRLRGWVVVVLWALPVLAVFVVGRSFHAPYYVQWAPPLALLAGASVARPVWRAVGAALPRRLPVRAVAGTLAVLGLGLALPLLGTQWQAAHTVETDRVYFDAGAALAALPPEVITPTLALDPGYTFIAGRPPARLPNGQRLVDGAGAMVYYGTDIDRAPWRDLIARALQFSHERNAQDTFYSLPAQASVLAELPTSGAVIIDGKIAEPDLRPQSIQLIQLLSAPPQNIDYAHLYPLQLTTPLGPTFLGPGGLELWAGTVEGVKADGSGAGPRLFGAGDGPGGAHLFAADTTVAQIGLYWRVPPTFQPVDYRVLLRVQDTAGRTVAQTDSRPDEDRAATHTWRPGWIYPDLHNLVLPPGPGRYTLALALAPDGQPASTPWQAPLVLIHE